MYYISHLYCIVYYIEIRNEQYDSIYIKFKTTQKESMLFRDAA